MAFTTACRDGKQTLLPTDPAALGARQTMVPGTCTSLSNLTALVNTVFAGGAPNANSALGKLDNMAKQLSKGKIVQAQDQAQNLIQFIQQKAASGSLAGTPAQVQALINGILCYVGLTSNTFLIYPSDQPQILLHPSGLAGVSLQGNTVNTPSLLTIDLLDPSGPSPLITKLDKYPEYIQLTISSPLTKPAIVGVCPSASVPTDVVPHLRLGHQASTGFELTPRADASFLACATIAQSKVPSWVRRLASLVSPKMLYAKQVLLERGGGVGGTATEFSPFGPVDEELRAGGVGGTSTEFLRTPATPAPSAPAVNRSLTPSARSNALSVTCPIAQAPVGTALSAACRPAILITTHNGTVMQNVPVSWAINLGGGTIAPQNLLSATCGASFGSTAATTTDLTGKASVCWTMGATVGLNTVIATASAGGDAPAGVTFLPPGQSFSATATANATTTTVTCPATVPYTGANQNPCSATVAGPGLSQSVPVVYTPAPARDAGAYVASAAFAATGSYLGSTGSSAFNIATAAAVATAGSGTMTLGGTVPSLPCVVTGLVAADAGTVTCTTAAPASPVAGPNTTAAVVSPASPTNYTVQLAGGTLTVLYAQKECFTGIATSLPPTTSFVAKGTNLPVKCRLQTAAATPAAGGSGNLAVYDIGANGLSAAVAVFTQNNAFVQVSGSYNYGLDTSPAAFVSGHYYKITASWNDGSTTNGYIYLQ
ncbi:MAG: hypothetical protein ABIY52_10015 [Gemmatimonadaceae bacterium]